MKFTTLSCDHAKPHPDPKQKRIEYNDTHTAGLTLIVQSKGHHKSWAFRYRFAGKKHKLTLGQYKNMDLALARKKRQEALDVLHAGRNPAVEKQAKKHATSDDIDDAFRLFLDRHTKPKGRPIRESTRRETARLLGLKRDRKDAKKWVPTGNGVLKAWKGRKLLEITRSDVMDLVDDMKETPTAANRTLSALKTCFSFHMRRDPDSILKSPCDGVAELAEGDAEQGGRDRTLTDKELAALWRVADTADLYGRMVQLLILTGCRRDEVREAAWAEFDMKQRQWLIPGRRTKNGRDHLVPITDVMARVLKELPKGKLLFTTTGDTAISGLSKIKKRLEKAMAKDLKAEPERWTLHDLRRTFVTGLQRAGVPVYVAEACVNHASGTVSGVTAVYARHDYKDEKAEALKKWSQHVETISLVE